MSRTLRISAAGAMVVAMAFIGGVGAPTSPAVAAAPAQVSVPASQRISGVDLQTLNNTNPSVNFQKLAADGANSVDITVWWQVPSSDSSSIAPNPTATISDAVITTLTQQAQAAGLQVSITPDFIVGSTSDPQWRGYYDPPDPTTFFSNYTAMVDHYAALAQKLNMPMFWVGSEMVSSERYTPEWETLIASVRQSFSGKLLYEVNWSNLQLVQFYSALDAMSISAYAPLSDQSDPSLPTLLSGWTNYKGTNFVAQVQQAEQTWQKPIYFGEAGYSPSFYAAQAPYSETWHGSDPALQYRCFVSLLETFRGFSWWGGINWWAWDGGIYNMDGQPAEALIGTQAFTESLSSSPPSSSSGGTGGGAGSGTSSGGGGSSHGSSGSAASSGGTHSSASGGARGSSSGHIVTAGGSPVGSGSSSNPAGGAASLATLPGGGVAPANAPGTSGGGAPGTGQNALGRMTVSHSSTSGAETPLIIAGAALIVLIAGGVAVSRLRANRLGA